MAVVLWLHLLWLEACLPTALVILGSAAAGNAAGKRKRTNLTFAQKLKIVEHYEANPRMTAADTADWFNSLEENQATKTQAAIQTTRTSVAGWLKPDEIAEIKAAAAPGTAGKEHLKQSAYPELEEALVTWHQSVSSAT